jgi:hypothetical protein
MTLRTAAAQIVNNKIVNKKDLQIQKSFLPLHLIYALFHY